MDQPAPPKIEQLQWQEEELGSIPMPRSQLRLTRSFGSGLARGAADPPGEFWAIGDRGPNLKVETLIDDYGADHLGALRCLAGAKVMPRLDVGPRLARLKVTANRIELLETFAIADREGRPVSGLPMPGSAHAVNEPALTLQGDRIDGDPSGLDTEGLVAMDDGTFIFSEEFGPSLVRAGRNGQVIGRYLPMGMEAQGARYALHQTLPAIAGKRQLNRGFEAIAVSPDQKSLLVAFQSPLAHPDEAAHKRARHVRLWRINVASMKVEAQFAYPLDAPDSFRRDNAKGAIEWGDLKISELVALPGGSFLVLERASETTKIYRIVLRHEDELPAEHLDLSARPTLEELSADGQQLPALAKLLLFSTDDSPEVAADLEGMVALSPHELLLVNDSDFGVEGAQTSFWKATFSEPLLS